MPKRETKEDLLAKLDGIEVEDHLPIDKEDREFCDKIQTLFEAKIKELEAWKTELERLNQSDLNKATYKELGKPYRHSSEQVVSKATDSDKDKNPFIERGDFSPLYGIVWINQAFRNIEYTLSDEIISHFRGKYNLKSDVPTNFFRDSETDEINKEVHYSELVKALVRECGGVSFIDVGIENVKSRFRKQYYSSFDSNRVSVVGNKIKIDSYFGFYGDYKWGWSDSYIGALDEALALYELGEVGTSMGLYNRCNSKPVDFKGYSIAGHKVTHIKPFKNNRLDITFADKELPYDFIQFMGMNKDD